MNAIIAPRFLAGIGLAALLPFCAHAQTVFLNETFESDTLGSAPADSAQRRTLGATIVAGSTAIGTDNAARFNDSSATAGTALEYNVGTSALGSMFISFDLLNNAPSGTGSGTNPFIFSVGNWSNATSTLLNASNTRAFGLEFSANGTTSTLKIRVDATPAVFVINSTYSMSAQQSVKIFINDHDTNTLDYLVPGTSTSATLGANSAVIFVNNSLVGSETTAGFAMSVIGSTGGNTTGDATLGRLGFSSGSATISDFSVDNIYASTIPSAVPEPSAAAALAGLGVLGFVATRRRRA